MQLRYTDGTLFVKLIKFIFNYIYNKKYNNKKSINVINNNIRVLILKTQKLNLLWQIILRVVDHKKHF